VREGASGVARRGARSASAKMPLRVQERHECCAKRDAREVRVMSARA